MTTSKNLLALLPLLAAFAAMPAGAAADAGMAPVTASAPQPDAVPMTEGEIRKVDVAAGKLTIKHGPIANLEMGAMTMIFRVQDPAMLRQVKEGDLVKFAVARANGALTVTTLVVQPPPQ